MKTKTENPPQAFPGEQGHIPEGTWNQTWDPGMSERTYVATALMASYLVFAGDQGRHACAAEAVRAADTLIQTLREQNETTE